MSKKRQEEIIELLEGTIQNEMDKFGGGNTDTIEKLTKKLTQVREWKKKK